MILEFCMPKWVCLYKLVNTRQTVKQWDSTYQVSSADIDSCQLVFMIDIVKLQM